jgi:hypothetical protein
MFLHDDAGLDARGHKVPTAETDINFTAEDPGEGWECEVLAVEANFYAWVGLSDFPCQYSHENMG